MSNSSLGCAPSYSNSFPHRHVESDDVLDAGNSHDHQWQVGNGSGNGNGKNIVMCLDGTNCEFGPKPFTNVLSFYRMLWKDDETQLCYYQPGIGANPRVSTNLFSSIRDGLDAMIAFSMKSQIIDAYTFLARCYKDGDRIYLIGFSRGAFTARAIAGMIEKVGLLKRGNENLVDLAYQCYISWEYNESIGVFGDETTLVNEFKRTFSRKNTDVHFMGLWDSINSVGIIRDRMFPYTSRTKGIKHVRHAVSIDERRGKFKQCLFTPYTYCPNFFIQNGPYEKVGDDRLCNVSNPMLKSEPASLFSTNDLASNQDRRIKSLPDLLFTETQSSFVSSTSSSHQQTCGSANSDDFVEKWFCGDHSDVGGGWGLDHQGNALSNIPLKWVVSEALLFGVKFKGTELDRLGKNTNSSFDILSCKHDLLVFDEESWFTKLVKLIFSWFQSSLPQERPTCRNTDSILSTFLWWLGEILPLRTNIEDSTARWKSYYLPNLGRPRKIPQNAQFHWSVYWKLKMDPTYRPKNLPFDPNEILDSFDETSISPISSSWSQQNATLPYYLDDLQIALEKLK